MSDNTQRRPPPMVGLTIDGKTGAPKFDDPENAPEAQKAMLTDDHLAKMDPDLVRRLGMDDPAYVAKVRETWTLSAPVEAKVG